MRKVGTISSSIGLIFLGIWMILNKSNPQAAQEMLKWWPVVIIFMGIEVLVYFGKRSGSERVGFSFLIIPVIIIFIIVNVSQGIENKLNINFGRGLSINKMVDIFKDSDLKRYKMIDSSKTFDEKVNMIVFNTPNADINIKKSDSGKTEMKLKVYVLKDNNINSYDIKDKADGDKLNINITEDYVKRVSGDIYIPDGCSVSIAADNIRLNSDEEISKSSIKVESDNSAVTVNKINELSIDSDNISLEVKNASMLSATGDSGLVKVDGSVEKIKLVLDSGKVDVKNESGKDVDIKVNDGIANYKTRINDADVSLKLDNGVCSLNGEKRVNAGLSQKLGNGQNRVSISVDDGTLSFISQEW